MQTLVEMGWTCGMARAVDGIWSESILHPLVPAEHDSPPWTSEA